MEEGIEMLSNFKFGQSDRLVHKTYGFNRIATVLSRNIDLDAHKEFYAIQVYDRAAGDVRTQIHERDVVETSYEVEKTH